MKDFFRNTRFKIVLSVAALLLLGALIAGAAGHGETAQSAVVGTVFAPFHYVAKKASDGIDRVFGNLKRDAEYEKEIKSLRDQLNDYKSKLSDYENIKRQNELYKDFLELKEKNPEFKFEEASVIARDSADIYKSFTISKGSVNGIEVGDAVLYRKALVGVVQKVYPDYSVVRTVLDAGFNVSAYELVSNEISYVTGTARLAGEGKCKMANLSSSTKVAYGSIICTAGIGGTVPKGLVIGTVSSVEEENTDISSYAVITPEVSPDEITDCIVLTDF
ncbi:MAG: rod shape-determining protein MreC [Eubacterium sp.]|nr:rod shape-determining protein MreC [Eubacterium sp.]